MKEVNLRTILWGQFTATVALAKVVCLNKQGREEWEQVYGIEQDAEYYPEFKACIKDTVSGVLKRNAERLGEKSTLKGFIEGKEEPAINKALEAIKLIELRESDQELFMQLENEIRNRPFNPDCYYEGTGGSDNAEPEVEAAGADDDDE